MGLSEGQHPVNMLTEEDRVRGGKSLSPMKVLANSARRRKYCNLDCPFSDACPVLPLAMSESERLPNGKQPCKLKKAPKAMQRRIQNMFLNGEEGLLNEIRQTLFVTSTRLGDDNKERLQYADSLMKFHRSCYGEKSQLTASPEPLIIDVRQIDTKDGRGQEVRIGKQDRAAVLLSRNQPPRESVDLDPETLLLSPILDTIVGRGNDETSD